MKKFEEAQQRVKQLAKRPDNATLLELYALFKQGKEGDVSGSRPSRLKLKERAKYDAWAAKQGMSQDDARDAYCALVVKLEGK